MKSLVVTSNTTNNYKIITITDYTVSGELITITVASTAQKLIVINDDHDCNQLQPCPAVTPNTLKN